MSKPRKKKRPPKRVLALPDLEQSKAAVLNSLSSESHCYQWIEQWREGESASWSRRDWEITLCCL